MRDLTAVKAALNAARDRAGVLGLRQLRDAVQGLPPGGRAARPVREGRRRGERAPVHRGRAERGAAHPVGQGRRLRGPGRHAGEHGIAIGTVNANVFQDDDYMLGSVTNPDPRVRARPSAHLLECVDIMDPTGSRDLKLWFSDGTNYPGQDDIRARQDRLAEALAERLRPARRRTSGCCWSTSCSSRPSTPPTCPTGAPPAALPGARPEGPGRHRHRAPRARHQHRVHRGDAAAGGQARRLRLQLPLLRRRRPDGRRGRPVPAVPHHARGRQRRARSRPPPGSRSCSTSATTSSRRSRR